MKLSKNANSKQISQNYTVPYWQFENQGQKYQEM